MVVAIESCNVRPNKWAISPVSAGGSALIESCNATDSGAVGVSARLPDSSTKSWTCANKESCNAQRARCRPRPYPGWQARQACTRTTCTGPQKYWVFGGLGQPGGLAGQLARAPTRHGRAIPVALTAASVDVEKLTATQALALSGLRHRHSPMGSATSAKSTPLAPAGIQSEEDGSSHKKTRQGR